MQNNLINFQYDRNFSKMSLTIISFPGAIFGQ
jgi:hypothetical protein